MCQYEENKSRSQLNKIKPHDDKEIKAEFDYDEVSDLAYNLFEN